MLTNTTTNQGWTPSAASRGTADILQSSLLTIGLCIWTSVCPNLPSSSEKNRWFRLLYKFQLACLGILGPEFVLIVATGQLSSAHRSRKAFQKDGYTGWTLKHAFFADMGGFVLHSPDIPDFPIDAEQLLWLVKNKYVEYPTITAVEIDDRNKSDGLGRIITVVQAVWFSVNCIFRATQGLHITTLELTTVSFILMMLATSYCWLYKPQDVTVPTVLETKTSIAAILAKEGRDLNTYYRWTPFDFISREEWVYSLLWNYYIGILVRLRNIVYRPSKRAKPHGRIPDDKLLKVTHLWIESMSAFFVIAFFAVFIAAWNFNFPTAIEKVLWRAAAIFYIIYGVVGGLHTWYWHRWRRTTSSFLSQGTSTIPAVRDGDISLPHHSLQHVRHDSETQMTLLGKLANKMRNISEEKDPELQVSLRMLLPATFLCAIYCVFRAYILVEDVIGLRSLPPSAFQTVEWSRYIPHI